MNSIRNIINFKIIIAGIIFGVLAFSALVAILWISKSTGHNPIPATAILNVIEAPTATPLVLKPTPTGMATPGQEPAPAANISIGNYVQVSGTGGDGLRLHEAAGVASKVRFIALESEVFIVKDGPIDMDGYSWWYLQDPYSENAAGWGVANYLLVVQNP